MILGFVMGVVFFTWIGGMLAVIAAVRRNQDHQSQEIPKPTVYWPHVYELEREIYGHTFKHMGAPPDLMNPVATAALSPNEARLREGTAIPYKNIEMQANGVLSHREPITVVNRARKEAELILAKAQLEGRHVLTDYEDKQLQLLFEVIGQGHEHIRRAMKLVW